jgi:hypothetical protein
MSLTKGLVIAILCAAGAAGVRGMLYSLDRNGASAQPVSVSIIQLIATPERYDGKLVTVVGYLSYGGPDGDGLSLSKDDYENGAGNGLPVARTKEMWKDREKLYDMYVAVTGMFRAEKSPPTSVPRPAGQIIEIRRCSFMSDPNHPMAERLKGLPGVQVGPPKN